MLTYSKLDLEIWYLAVRVLGLILAGTLIVVGIVNQNTEKKKLLRFPELKKYKNPLPTLWVWIALNTIAQLGNVIESLVFTFNTSLGCRFSTNSTANFIATFTMLFLTYYMAIIPTLWIFWCPICKTRTRSRQRSERYESYDFEPRDIEIMATPCHAESYPNSSNQLDD